MRLERSPTLFPKLMASLAIFDDSAGKEYFLCRPTPPFDCDFEGDERSSNDADENWLPEVTYNLRQLPRHDRFDRRLGQ